MLAILALLLLAQCGGDDDGGSDGAAVDSPCDLADAALVQEVFGGTVASGIEGPARDCEFAITGGLVPDLQVFDAGEASIFDSVRSGYEDNRGGTIDVAGIGDEAFYPGDTGPILLVVKAGGQNFVVSAGEPFTEPPAGTDELVAELARRIAERLTS